jgi:hypothetical protein
MPVGPDEVPDTCVPQTIPYLSSTIKIESRVDRLPQVIGLVVSRFESSMMLLPTTISPAEVNKIAGPGRWLNVLPDPPRSANKKLLA